MFSLFTKGLSGGWAFRLSHHPLRQMTASTQINGYHLPKAAERATKYGEKDVWAIFTPLANAHKAVNLGQGFPNIPAPAFVKAGACEAINNDLNQYAPSKGLPRLRNALASFYGEGIFNRCLDAEKEILVTQGANQGISVTMQAFINPGDEVILVEPYFDIYRPSIEVCGGRVVTVPLRLNKPFEGTISANDWKLNMEELASKVTPRTKVILLNNPHNPTGKLFSRKELEEVGKVAKEHNLLVFSDEVYDNLYYDDAAMERIANVPGMWERTLTFGSGGKTFGVTGWRIGWIIGSAELIKPILAIQARTVFTTPTPLQDAVALGFEEGHKNGYFAQMRHDYQRRRDKAVAIFKELGLPVAIPHGSYFFMVDTKKIRVDLPPRSSEEVSDPTIMESRDYAICRWLTTEIGVTAIPPSAFYSPENTAMAANMIRICFCKTDETLDAAQDRLKKLLPYLK